ncbi:hypothetical protein AURDEDRAFT_166477 [Auricularia subglabra TFB-10046 SS5]|nr:hypothetical protein AURDEDRAFT_166477 [Auricularia subglabra TFB-10046 SS5]
MSCSGDVSVEEIERALACFDHRAITVASFTHQGSDAPNVTRILDAPSTPGVLSRVGKVSLEIQAISCLSLEPVYLTATMRNYDRVEGLHLAAEDVRVILRDKLRAVDLKDLRFKGFVTDDISVLRLLSERLDIEPHRPLLDYVYSEDGSRSGIFSQIELAECQSHVALLVALWAIVSCPALAQDLSTNSAACFQYCIPQATQENESTALKCNPHSGLEVAKCVCDHKEFLADAEACVAQKCPVFKGRITQECSLFEGAAAGVKHSAAASFAVGAGVIVSGILFL